MNQPSIKVLEVILTAQCNLRCGYCYQNDKQARRMEWDTLRSALAVALASRSRTLEIRFIGGEPLLEMPLIRRAVQFVEQRRARNREVIFSISTNGVILY